jgi:hypothetical protein
MKLDYIICAIGITLLLMEIVINGFDSLKNPENVYTDCFEKHLGGQDNYSKTCSNKIIWQFIPSKQGQCKARYYCL